MIAICTPGFLLTASALPFWHGTEVQRLALWAYFIVGIANSELPRWPPGQRAVTVFSRV